MPLGEDWLDKVTRAAYDRSPRLTTTRPKPTWDEIGDENRARVREVVVDVIEGINDVDEAAYRVIHRLSQPDTKIESVEIRGTVTGDPRYPLYITVPSRWNPHWNYHLGGEPRSICACPDGPYEGARPATAPRYCERCGGLVEPVKEE